MRSADPLNPLNPLDRSSSLLILLLILPLLLVFAVCVSRFDPRYRSPGSVQSGRQPERERRSLPRRAFDRHLPSHESRQTPTERQPQTGTIPPPGVTGIELREWHEHGFALV